MLNIDSIRETLNRIKLDTQLLDYLYWKWDISHKGTGYLIKFCIEFISDKDDPYLRTGEEFFISERATKDHVVRTAYKAVCDFLIVEAQRGFKYKSEKEKPGVPIFHPRWSVDSLAGHFKDEEVAAKIIQPWETEPDTKIPDFIIQ